MSYTSTFDATPTAKVKVNGNHSVMRFRHLAREADEAAGFDFGHSNENIDPDRVALNFSFVNDRKGGVRALRSVDGKPPSMEMESYFRDRLKDATKSMKKDGSFKSDAVGMRGLILQIDPKWYEDHNPDWREEGLNEEALRLISSQLKWVAEEFGQENIVGGSIHLDETSPQLHVSVTPVTDDGRLSQKDFFKGPGHLKQQHRSLRKYLEAAGYAVDYTVSPRSKERLCSKGLARKAALLEQKTASVDALERNLRMEKLELPRMRKRAKEEGRKEGKEEGLEQARQSNAKLLEAQREELQQQMQQALQSRATRLEKTQKALANTLKEVDTLAEENYDLLYSAGDTYAEKYLGEHGLLEAFQRDKKRQQMKNDRTRRSVRQLMEDYPQPEPPGLDFDR